MYDCLTTPPKLGEHSFGTWIVVKAPLSFKNCPLGFLEPLSPMCVERGITRPLYHLVLTDKKKAEQFHMIYSK